MKHLLVLTLMILPFFIIAQVDSITTKYDAVKSKKVKITKVVVTNGKTIEESEVYDLNKLVESLKQFEFDLKMFDDQIKELNRIELHIATQRKKIALEQKEIKNRQREFEKLKSKL